MSDTVFKKVDYSLSKLMDDIEMGTVGLPDIQRPFVWKNAKVRDLFDSIYRGYPVGYFLFWQSAYDGKHKQIGTDQKQKIPSLLIVDGQQRLTSLYAVIKGVPVVRETYEKEQIEIAFNPITETFEVADVAIRRNSEFIPNISILWAKNANLFEIVGRYVEQLKKQREASQKPTSPEEITKVQSAFQRASNLLSYPFTALELASTVNEEQVAEVFVRINSKGKVLNQSDFILTLMSVFWEEGRAQLEEFCREARVPSKGKPSPFNYFIEPDPDNLLRVSIGVGFGRARLKYGYSLLRGKDLETDQFSDERRIQQFEILRKAQSDVLYLENWHGFLRTLHLAGYRGSSMIGSTTTLIYAYVFFILGKNRFGIEQFTLSKAIARWYFMSSLTSRYTNSPESAMESDLAAISDFTKQDEFLNWMQKTIDNEFTEDFWNINLPDRLDTSSGSSPLQNAYFAALNLLHARVLFSQQKVVDLLDPSQKSTKSAAERHHLFTKKYLKKQGITKKRETNQVANFALVEWNDNIDISGDAPKDYWPVYAKRFSESELTRMCHWHALPMNWQAMDYWDFLEARRKLIAKVIKEGFDHISHDASATTRAPDNIQVGDLLKNGETTRTEFKSTLRVNLHTGQPDKKMEHACLKTIAAFLNSSGGHLVVGVNDAGEPLGIEKDGFSTEDKMNLHFVNLVKDRLGPEHMLHIEPLFESLNGKRVLVVRCTPSDVPVYLKDGTAEQFFTRTGAATTELSARQIQTYVQQRF